jgi:hypothetical protein
MKPYPRCSTLLFFSRFVMDGPGKKPRSQGSFYLHSQGRVRHPLRAPDGSFVQRETLSSGNDTQHDLVRQIRGSASLRSTKPIARLTLRKTD